MTIKIFILVKTAVTLLHYYCVRCFSCSSNLFSVLEYFLFVEFLYHRTNIVRRLLLYCYFVGEEERIEIDFELLTILLEFQALEDFLISDLDDALVINMVQSGKCKIHPNHTIPLSDTSCSIQCFKILRRYVSLNFCQWLNFKTATWVFYKRCYKFLNFRYMIISVRKVDIAIGDPSFIFRKRNLKIRFAPRLNNKTVVSCVEGPPKFKRKYTMQIFFYRENKRMVGSWRKRWKRDFYYILPECVLVRRGTRTVRISNGNTEICLCVDINRCD